MMWSKEINNHWLSVGIHKRGIALGFSVSKYSIDLDLIFIFISLEF